MALGLADALAACARPGLEPPADAAIQADVERTLAEDVGSGDLSAALLPARPAQARIRVSEVAGFGLRGKGRGQHPGRSMPETKQVRELT